MLKSLRCRVWRLATARDVLDQLWHEAGVAPPVEVALRGQDPVFPLPFRVGDAGAAVAEHLAQAVRRWDAAPLEDAIVRAGACAGMARTHDEWLSHDQGATVARLPLFEVIRVADSPPEPLPDGSRPLSGVRVIDVTRVLAGPMCARTLAEHGADVLRIGTTALPNNDLQNIDTGHGKRSTGLDLAG